MGGKRAVSNNLWAVVSKLAIALDSGTGRVVGAGTSPRILYVRSLPSALQCEPGFRGAARGRARADLGAGAAGSGGVVF